MKAAVFSVLVILAGAFALPPQNAENRDIVTDFIRDLINNVATFIKDSGFDPYEITNYRNEFSGNLFELKVSIENLAVNGASNIVINNLFNNVLFGTYDFDVVLPEISVELGNAGLAVAYDGAGISGEIGGRLSVKNIRLAGQVRYEGSIIVGVRIVNLVLQTGIGNIESDVIVFVDGNDHSAAVNTFLNDTLPNTLENYKTEINALFAQIILGIINRL